MRLGGVCDSSPSALHPHPSLTSLPYGQEGRSRSAPQVPPARPVHLHYWKPHQEGVWLGPQDLASGWAGTGASPRPVRRDTARAEWISHSQQDPAPRAETPGGVVLAGMGPGADELGGLGGVRDSVPAHPWGCGGLDRGESGQRVPSPRTPSEEDRAGPGHTASPAFAPRP